MLLALDREECIDQPMVVRMKFSPIVKHVLHEVSQPLMGDYGRVRILKRSNIYLRKVGIRAAKEKQNKTHSLDTIQILDIRHLALYEIKDAPKMISTQRKDKNHGIRKHLQLPSVLLIRYVPPQPW